MIVTIGAPLDLEAGMICIILSPCVELTIMSSIRSAKKPFGRNMEWLSNGSEREKTSRF